MRFLLFLSVFTFVLVTSCVAQKGNSIRGSKGGQSAEIKDTSARQPGTRQRPLRSNEPLDCNDLEMEENGLVFHSKTHAPFTGMCRTFYEDNRLEREVNFVDGLEDGASITYYQKFILDPNGNRRMDDSSGVEPGNKKALTNHKMGVEHGEWKFWYEDGSLAWKGEYLEGKKTGLWEYYSPDGKTKKKEENWKEGKKDGVYKEWYPNGNLKLEINYKADYLDGSYKSYFDNGSVFIETNYIQGKEEGESISYYKNGQIASIKRYKEQKPDGTWRSYYDDGKEKSIAVYLEGKPQGEHKEFYHEGQLKSKKVYRDGKLIVDERYDEFGNKIEPVDPKKKKEEEEE